MIAHASEYWPRWSTHYWIAFVVAACGFPVGAMGMLALATATLLFYVVKEVFVDAPAHWREKTGRDRWKWVVLDSFGGLAGPALVWLQAYAYYLAGG